MMNNLNINELSTILQKAWSRETCYPRNRDEWTRRKPALGQCAVTALIVQEYFGGEIAYCRHLNHYWNKLSDQSTIDLTRSQFPISAEICLDKIVNREDIMNSENAKRALTKERYEILKHRVEQMADALVA